jgi:DNA-binding NarL/FixJ family response regulator
MNDSRIRLLVADDHNLFRDGIINLMETEKDIFIVGEAETGEELVNKYFELKPDIILADISMPGMTGIEALKKIRERDNSVKVLFLSMFEGDEYIYYCIKAGSMGLISKKVKKGELLYAIQNVNEGKRYFGVDINEERLKEIIEKFDKSSKTLDTKDDSLTPREIEILKQISEGLTSNEIAEKLYISKRTIDTHRTNLMQKLNLKSLPELIKYAINFSLNDESG